MKYAFFFRSRLGSGLVLGVSYIILATPVARDWLESTMTAHMLLQIPLLALMGGVACGLLPEYIRDRFLVRIGGAIPCVVVALFVSSYWMLPRALDAALTESLAELAKFISFPMLVGVPLVLAWKHLSLIGRGFVLTNFFSMLAVLGWLYIVAPVRVCNSYLVNDQENAGWLMVLLAGFLFIGWLGSLFIDNGSRPYPENPNQ